MPRLALEVRDAVPADADALLALWRDVAGVRAAAGLSTPQEAASALAHVAEDPGTRLVVALVGHQVIGSLCMNLARLSPLHTEQLVHTTFPVVSEEHRRHGVGHRLVEEAVAWAEELGIEQVSAIPDSASRETNRFFARLGLGTVATVRVASTATLRNKLGPKPSTAAGTAHPLPVRNSRNVKEIVAARRSMRRTSRAG